MSTDDSIERIPPEVCERLGYYVYLYVDPRTQKPFYVGKGRGNRVLSHVSSKVESRKREILDELEGLGLRPRLDILAHRLPSEETAFRIEAAVIDLLGLDSLANKVRGWKTLELGRIPLGDLVAYYAAKPVEIDDPVLLIRINLLYRHGMPEDELYDATRGVWKLSKRREKARYALAVFQGVVRGVWEIESWHPAGTTPYQFRDQEEERQQGRWEFVGHPAPPEIQEKYFGKSVAKYFRRGQQNPVVYVEC